MKCKRDPGSKIVKWKARLCAHGGMQTNGVNYWGNLFARSFLDHGEPGPDTVINHGVAHALTGFRSGLPPCRY